MNALRPLLALLLGLALLPAAAAPPADSLHRLEDVYTDQHGEDFRLADLAGRPVLVSMFYTGCQVSCPLIIDGLRRARHSLPADRRDDLVLLLVSLDSDHDDPARLRETARLHRLDDAGWRLARADAAAVRRLAALLDVRYRHLPDGSINHTSPMILLDAHGRRVARADTLSRQWPEAFRQALLATVDAQ